MLRRQRQRRDQQGPVRDIVLQDPSVSMDFLHYVLLPGVPTGTAQDLAATCRMLRTTWYRTLHELPVHAFRNMESCDDMENFHALRRLSLAGGRPGYITDECLTRFTNLRELSLDTNDYFGENEKRITDAGLAKMTTLRRLVLTQNGAITDDALSSLINLTWLGLRNNQSISDVGVEVLAQLEGLDLRDNDSITGDLFAMAPTLTRTLTTLLLDFNANISDSDLARLTSLTNLGLSHSESITGHALFALPNLRELGLYEMRTIGDDHLHGLTALTSLALVQTPRVSGHALTALASLTKLRVDSRTFKTSYLAHPQVASRLRDLRIGWSSEDDDATLPSLTSLTTLWIDQGSEAYNPSVSTLTALTTLGITLYAREAASGGRIDFDGLRSLTNLERLSIANHKDIRGSKLARRLTNLRVLDIRGCNNINCASLVHLQHLRRLVVDHDTGMSDLRERYIGLPYSITANLLLSLPSLVEVTSTEAFWYESKTKGKKLKPWNRYNRLTPEEEKGKRKLYEAGVRLRDPHDVDPYDLADYSTDRRHVW